MNEIKFANKIRQALNEGARLQSPTGVTIAARLRAARERAILARKPQREPALAWVHNGGDAGVMGGGGGFDGLSGFSLRVLLPTVLLVAGLVSIYNWEQDQRAADIVELDAQLLTDDLPIDAYLDRGFQTWLTRFQP